MRRHFYKDLKDGTRLLQTVVEERKGKLLVWYEDIDHNELKCYWTDSKEFLSKWRDDICRG